MRPIDWKTLDWKILAHCDAYAVKRTVEKADRVAETVVRPMSMRNFQEKLSSDALWKSVYDTLTRSYADLEENLSCSLTITEAINLSTSGKRLSQAHL